MICLDGAEGGGQILRTALALSALTQQPFKIINIRVNRPSPGLKPQHYTCVKALQELTNAKTDAQLDSKELTFIPEKYKAQNKTIDIGTAGSITLLLQSLMLPAMFSTRTHTLTIKGGTDTKWSMPIDYFTNVLLPQLNRFADIKIKLVQRGYYPKGGGELQVKISPKFKAGKYSSFEEFRNALPKIEITKQGHLFQIKGTSHASKDLEPAQVAERQAQAAKQELHDVGAPVQINVQYSDTLSTGSGITLSAIFSEKKDEIDFKNPIIIGTDALGERGKPAETVGKEAAEKLRELIANKIPTDAHLADNLVPFLALCKPSTIKTAEITQHIKTNIKVAEAFLGKCFKIEGNTVKTL